MAEAHVLNVITQHNKPFAVQGVVDFLQTQGIKKTAVQKALDALVESGKIIMKVRSRISRPSTFNRMTLQHAARRKSTYADVMVTGVWEDQDLPPTSIRQRSALKRSKLAACC
jgi:hypothetical protein